MTNEDYERQRGLRKLQNTDVLEAIRKTIKMDLLMKNSLKEKIYQLLDIFEAHYDTLLLYLETDYEISQFTWKVIVEVKKRYS